MADQTVTANDVRPLPGAMVQRYQAAAALAPGQAVYVDANGKVALADADATASSRIIGIVVSCPNGANICAADDWVDVVVLGAVTGFSSLDETKLLFASTTAGALEDTAPAGASSDFIWVAGYPISQVSMFVNPFTYDVAAQ